MEQLSITGDLYVSGTIYEGDNAGDDGFDSVDEITSGSSNQEFKASSKDEVNKSCIELI